MKTRIIAICKSICLLAFCFLTTVTVFPQSAGKPSVAVIEFDVTRVRVSREVGRELSDMLVNALLETQRFTVVERSRINLIQQEQIEALRGSIDPATGATIGKMTGAQFLVLASVTEFKQKKKGIGGFLKVPGTGRVATYEAIVKFNLRVVNSTTGEIVFSKPIEKEIKETGLAGDNTLLGIAVGESFESKAMHDAIEQAMGDAVDALVERFGSIPATQNSVATTASELSSVDCSRIVGANAPKIMVVIPEIHISQKIPDPAGETEIIKKLVAQRFNIVDQKQVAAIRDRETVLTALKNPQAAAALGIEFGADIIIIGEAFSELAGRERNMVSTRARVEARAIQTDNARILAADGKFGSGLDIAEFVSAKTALRNAGSQWADYFTTQICQASETPTASSSSSVEILVSNISYIQLKRFADKLETIPGIQNVEKKLTGNVARVTVQFNGSAEELADAIAETKFGTLQVNIVGLSGSKIEISVGK